MSSEERDAIGVNVSELHLDVMFSNEHTAVSATTRAGKTVRLMEGGHWSEAFR